MNKYKQIITLLLSLLAPYAMVVLFICHRLTSNNKKNFWTNIAFPEATFYQDIELFFDQQLRVNKVNTPLSLDNIKSIK